MAYKKSLLSSLVAIRYKDPIDSYDDLYNSGLPLLIPEASAILAHIASDPNPIIRDIFDRSITFSAKRGAPQWVLEK